MTSPPPIRVAAVFPEPTPYRAPLLDRVAALPGDRPHGRLRGRTPSPAARGTSSRSIAPSSSAACGVPGARARPPPRLPAHAGRRRRAHGRPAGRRRRLGLEHVRRAGRDRLVRDARTCRTCSSSRATTRGLAPGWRRTVKGTVVPPVVANASGVLVTGTLARDSMIARGARCPSACASSRTPSTSRSSATQADAARGRSGPSCGARSGPSADDVVVLSVARLAPGEGARRPRPRGRRGRATRGSLLVVAGEGPERARLDALARGARRPARARRATSTGSGSSSCTSRPTSSRCSRSASRGRSS